MRRKKAMVLILTVIMMSWSMFFTNTTSAEERKNNGLAEYMLITFLEDDEITDSQKEELENVGWKVEGNRVYKIGNFGEGTIKVNGKDTAINSDGSFFVEENLDKITVSVNEQEEKVVEKDSNGQYHFVQPISWDHFNEVMDHHDQESQESNTSALNSTDQNIEDHTDLNIVNTNNSMSGNVQTLGTTYDNNNVVKVDYYDKYKKGDWVHCNRFNGPSTDGVHYPHSNWRALRNFAHSDCDDAFAIRCLKDYTSETWCNGSGGAAACSGKLGHSKKYHKHS